MAPKNNQTGIISAPLMASSAKMTFQYITKSSGAKSETGYLLRAPCTGGAANVAAQQFAFRDLQPLKDNGFTCRLQAAGGGYDGYWLDLSNTGYVRPYSSSCQWRFVDMGEYWQWRHAPTDTVVTVTREGVSGTEADGYGPRFTYMRNAQPHAVEPHMWSMSIDIV